MFLLGDGVCRVLTTGRAALGATTNKQAPLRDAQRPFGLVALRTSYAALPHVDGAGFEERRFNHHCLNEHLRDRKWGGEIASGAARRRCARWHSTLMWTSSSSTVRRLIRKS